PFPYSFFFTTSSTPAIYTLSLHDALPIYLSRSPARAPRQPAGARPHQLARLLSADARGGGADRAGQAGFRLQARGRPGRQYDRSDRKSTRLNSSHVKISYAVFCLKKKKKT